MLSKGVCLSRRQEWERGTAGRQGVCAEGCKAVNGCLAVSKMEAA